MQEKRLASNKSGLSQATITLVLVIQQDDSRVIGLQVVETTFDGIICCATLFSYKKKRPAVGVAVWLPFSRTRC